MIIQVSVNAPLVLSPALKPYLSPCQTGVIGSDSPLGTFLPQTGQILGRMGKLSGISDGSAEADRAGDGSWTRHDPR